MSCYGHFVLEHTLNWVDNTITYAKRFVPVRPQMLNETETPEQAAARQLTAMAAGITYNQAPAMPTIEDFFRNPFAYPAILNIATNNGFSIPNPADGHAQGNAIDNIQGPSVDHSSDNIALNNDDQDIAISNNSTAINHISESASNSNVTSNSTVVPAVSSSDSSTAINHVPESASSNNVMSNSAIETAPKRKRATNTSAGPVKKAKTQSRTKYGASTNNSTAANDRDNEDDDEEEIQITLVKPTLTRTNRMVDPSNSDDAALIAAAIKGGNDIYDDNAADLTGDIKKSITQKSELFRNIQWGPAAVLDLNAPNSEYPTHPQFSQFVVGRWERLADGSVYDQKRKLLIKLTNPEGRRMVFKNPPPKDWNDQKAITNLNKRVSQQIRRNTPVRFREVVESYVHEERLWILNNLTQGKPRDGWKNFVRDFNARFAGSTLGGVEGVRPARTHSSLTKEIERFGKEFYAKGKVPVPKSKDADQAADQDADEDSNPVADQIADQVSQNHKTTDAPRVRRTIIKAFRRESGRICKLKINYWGDGAEVAGKPADYKPPTTTVTAAKGSKKTTKSTNSSKITKKSSGNPVRTRPSRSKVSKVVAKGKRKAE